MDTIFHKLIKLQAHIDLANEAVWNEVSDNGNPNKNLINAVYVLEGVHDTIDGWLSDPDFGSNIRESLSKNQSESAND